MEKKVTLAHGAGGKQTAELIQEVFAAHFSNPEFTADDAAVLDLGNGKIAMSTDGFIVSPYKFNGGNIGKLSICGTVNDLSCMGARPRYLTCSFIIEEGFPLSELEEIAASMEKTAKETGVKIVAGDTKVAGSGQVDHIFITTTGIGTLTEGFSTSGAYAKPGDAILVTGDIGRHGCTILLARENLGIEADIKSDCAPLWGTVESMIRETKDIHVIRDATRGGVGTVLYEIAAESNVGVRLDSAAIPVDPAVRGVCGMLGLDPLYLANEGTLVVIAPCEHAEALLSV
ncbi:MAG: hydrogenase expression/formation protein HypE, partial [Lachnospiraceae bacterium]|nr:hydrogenase expression/formation protein HypE [Lachnospiraceae bacterium]